MGIHRSIAVAAALTLTWSCGGSESSPGSAAGGTWIDDVMADPAYEQACREIPACAEPGSGAPGATDTIWRVRVARAPSGEVSIPSVEPVDVSEGDGVPVGNLGGSHVVVGLDASGEPVDLQPIRFPESLRIEYADGETEVRDLSARPVDAMAYLRADPAIESLAVLDGEGATVAAAALPERVASLPARRAGLVPFAFAPPVAADFRMSGLPPHCSHIVVLGGEHDRDMAQNVTFENELTLVRPGPWQLATVQAALARMTPLLCQSMARIAFGHAPERAEVAGAVNSFGAGDMILINLSADRHSEPALAERESSRLLLQKTVLHEAGHAAETLLTVEGDRVQDLLNETLLNRPSYSGSWEPGARSLARETIARVRLDKGLPAEWRRLHDSFVDHGWASPYPGKEAARGMSRFDLVRGGFISAYAASNLAEDIADAVATPYIAPEWTAGLERQGRLDLREDVGCELMQAHDEEGVPARFAAVYAKLVFLRDLGLVTEEGVDHCTGPNLGLPIDGEGFHFWQDGRKLRTMADEMEAGIGTLETGQKSFHLRAEGGAEFGGETYPASIELRLGLDGGLKRLKEVSWPRGIYELGLLSDNKFRLRLDGKPAGDFDARNGFVLVAQASNDRIAGSIFLTQALRIHAPLPVPQVFDPPLIIRFLIEN